MFGKFSYLVSILIFAGTPVILEFIFGYHFLKHFFKKIAGVVICFLMISPVIEFFALFWNAWGYNREKNLQLIILKSPIETVIFAIFISTAISFAVYAWTFYEDNKKPIFRTSLYDVFHGTYAIWRRNKPK